MLFGPWMSRPVRTIMLRADVQQSPIWGPTDERMVRLCDDLGNPFVVIEHVDALSLRDVYPRMNAVVYKSFAMLLQTVEYWGLECHYRLRVCVEFMDETREYHTLFTSTPGDKAPKWMTPIEEGF